MDTIITILRFISFFLSCIALGISIASLQSVEEDMRIMTELINLLEKKMHYVEKEDELRKR